MAVPIRMTSARLDGRPTIFLRFASDRLQRWTIQSRICWRVRRVPSIRSRSNSRRRPAIRAKCLQQTHAPQRNTFLKGMVKPFAINEFRAAAAHIENQESAAAQFGVSGNAAKD